jgi:exonuclease SbcD
MSANGTSDVHCGLPIANTVTVHIPRTGEIAEIAALPYPSEARLNELLVVEGTEDDLRQAYGARVGKLMGMLDRSPSGQPITLKLAWDISLKYN